jgi:SAM-dependent methyltransferase
VTDTGLTLVVPLYNEAGRFPRFARELAAFVARQPKGSELVFVDDGSVDATVTHVEDFLASSPPCPVRLVRRAHQGKGAAVQAGLATAGSELAGFCDLDLSTPLADLARVIAAARRAPIVAIGSRDLAASRVTKRQGAVREFLGRAYNRAVQLTLTPGIVDTQCGAKVARTSVWRAILPRCREAGFAWDVEVIAVATSLRIPVQEIAIEWRHDAGSRVNVLRDGVAMLRALPRIRRNVRRDVPKPAELEETGIFDDVNATVLAAADATHWWFRSKAALVSGLLRSFRPPDGRLVDLGGGSGGVTAMLGWPHDRVLVVEGNLDLLRLARHRHALAVAQSDLGRVPLATGSASAVCLLDVIEHLTEPGPTIREARRLLAPDGRLIVNVPGHPRLWSAADDALGHVRRYTRASLRTQLESEGFEVLFLSHVFSWLVAPVWLRRRASGGEPQLGLDVDSRVVDGTALLLTRLERAVVSRVALPFGTSVLCVAQPSGS